MATPPFLSPPVFSAVLGAFAELPEGGLARADVCAILAAPKRILAARLTPACNRVADYSCRTTEVFPILGALNVPVATRR